MFSVLGLRQFTGGGFYATANWLIFAWVILSSGFNLFHAVGQPQQQLLAPCETVANTQHVSICRYNITNRYTVSQ